MSVMEKNPIEIPVSLLEAPLLHLDEVTPQIPILQPEGEKLLSLLNQGELLPFSAQVLEEHPALLTSLDQAVLARRLEELGDRCHHAALLQGWSGLCLAEGALVNEAEDIFAPLLLWPVRLSETAEGWLLGRGSEGSQLNLPLLRRFPAPEGGWSLNREPLFRQVDQAVGQLTGWQRQEGLWLGQFPLFPLEWAAFPHIPARDGSALQQLEQLNAPLSPPDGSRLEGEEALVLPFPLDGTQMTALNRLMDGASLRVSGGQGTGKTQLAAGLLANALGSRMRGLYLSPRASDREDLEGRMKELGLDPLTLSLSSLGDRKSQALHQYNIAQQLKPERSSEGYFSLSAQLTQLSRQLDRYHAALHTPAKHGLSPFQLICRYLETDSAEGALTLPQTMLSHLDQEGLESRLDCARQLARLSQQLGGVAGHPLNLVRGSNYTSQLREELPQEIAALEEAITALEEAGNSWSQRTGLPLPQSQSDWYQFRESARLIRQWECYPAPWAASTRIPLLQDAVIELRNHCENELRLRRQLEQKWEDPVFYLDTVKLEKQWRFLKEGWTLPSEPDREKTLRQLLAQAEALLGSLESVGRQWSHATGVPIPTTRDSWERSYEVAAELARWKEIPREWGSCPGLPALLWDVGELIDHGRQAKEAKEVLLRDWAPAFLQLDGQALWSRWQDEDGFALGALKRQNELRAELEPLCQTRLTMNLLESSLRWLQDFQAELSQCDEIYHRWEPELKSVYRGEETVWIWLETARNVAEESHDWLTELTGSEDFLRNYGSSPEAIAAAELLQSQWDLARNTLGHLDVIIGRTGQPENRHWLKARREDCRRLRNLLQIRKVLLENAKEEPSLGSIGEALKTLAEHQREAEAANSIYAKWHAELKGIYLGAETDWEELLTLSIRAVNADEDLAELTGDLSLRARLAGDPEAQANAQDLCDAYEALCHQAEALAALASAHLCEDKSAHWLEELAASCQILTQHKDSLEGWMHWRKQSARAQRLGLGAFVTYLEHPQEEDVDLLSLFRKSIFRTLLQLELDWVPELKQFSSRQFSQILRQYAQLDETFTRRTREELRHLAAARLPDLNRSPHLEEEITLLRWANQTNGRDISLDGLVRGLPQLTQAYFSCVSAAPADALRIFRDGPLFDYVIVDRAETIPAPIGEALLDLGKTALLLSGGGHYDNSLFPNGDSLWQRSGFLPCLCLRQCYLPRQESLLWLEGLASGVSGYPSCHPGDFSIRSLPVVGQLKDGVNRAEASAVAAQALHLLESGREHLAVAALTLPQLRQIRTYLAQAAQDNPHFAQALHQIPVCLPQELGTHTWEYLFFSLTLAPDPSGSLSEAMSLAARWDGVQPLTDALACAGRRFWLFSSLDQEDWPLLGEVQPLLEDFLRYAQAEVHQEPIRPLSFRNRIQQELCLALRERGYLAEPGPSPVSVRVASPEHNSGYLLGILMDGESYSTFPRTRERELTQTELLQAQGWNLCRVWVMDWLRNRERVISLLLDMLEQIDQGKEASKASSEEAPSPPLPDQNTPQIPLYTPAHLTVMGIRDNEVANPSFRNRIYQVVEQIIVEEAPLSVDQLTTHMLSAFGLDPQDEELRGHCASLWRKLGLRITREDGTGYVWRVDQDPDRYRRFRASGPGEHFRRPADVSCQESANAVAAVLWEQTALSRPQLLERTALLLGYDAKDPEALDCARRGLDYAALMGRVWDTPIGTWVVNPGAK